MLFIYVWNMYKIAKNISMEKQLKNKIIIFGRPAIVLSTLRCLVGTGWKADIIVIGSQHELVKWSRYVDHYYAVGSEKEGLNFIEKNYIKETFKPIIVSCNDSVAELIDENRERLKNHFIISDCSESNKYLSYWMRKDVMCELAVELGFNVPKTWVLNLDEGVKDWDVFVFPCITKALKSSKGQKNATHICQDQEELQSAVLDAKCYTDFLLVQEFIEFDQGYCTLGVRFNNSKGTVIGSTGKRIRSNLHAYGYPTFSHLEHGLPPRVSEEAIKFFVEKTGYTGVFSFETIVAGDKTYFIEINFRTDGKIFGMPATGCNIIAQWICDSAEISFPVDSPKKDVYIMFGPEDYEHVRAKELVVGNWAKDVFRTNCFHVWNLKDPMPFIMKCLSKVKRIMCV